MRNKIGGYVINYEEIEYYKNIISYIPNNFFTFLEKIQIYDCMIKNKKDGEYLVKAENYCKSIIKKNIYLFSKTQIMNKEILTYYNFDSLNMSYDDKQKFIKSFSQQTYSRIKNERRITIKTLIKTIELLGKNVNEIFWRNEENEKNEENERQE